MKQVFIYSYGKVILENEKLFIRKTKPSLTISEVLPYVFPLAVILRFFLYLFEKESPKRNVGLVIGGFLAFYFSIELAYKLYKLLYKKSFARRIPLQKIIAWHTEEDPNGLEVHVCLQLRSGKERNISFRKLEKEQERLVEMLSQYLASPKFA